MSMSLVFDYATTWRFLRAVWVAGVPSISHARVEQTISKTENIREGQKSLVSRQRTHESLARRHRREGRPISLG